MIYTVYCPKFVTERKKLTLLYKTPKLALYLKNSGVYCNVTQSTANLAHTELQFYSSEFNSSLLVGFMYC